MNDKDSEKPIQIQEVQTVWVASVNTDLTEGRGRQKILHVCESMETAIRMGEGKDVQGSNASVSEATAIKVEGNWLVPGEVVPEAKAEQIKKNRPLYPNEKAADQSWFSLTL